MATLEVHTLNQETVVDMPEALAVRAGVIAAGAGAMQLAEKAPELPGAFSIEDRFFIEEAYLADTYSDEPAEIYNVLGDKLINIESALDKKERLAMFPIALGGLASETSISMTTGCWSLVADWRDFKYKEAWRNDKGYMYVWNPEHFGFKINREQEFNGIALHRMAYNMKLRAQGLPDLNKYQQVDHLCRRKECCNIDHHEIVDHRTNNTNRDQARDLEAALKANQTIVGSMGPSWLESKLQAATTEFTNIIISTPDGPYRLIIVEKDPLTFRAEPEHCDLLEAVRPPAPPKYERPSRSKRTEVSELQDILFEQARYAAKKTKSGKLYKAFKNSGM